MNWLKVGAVVIGGIVVFFVVGSVIHAILAMFSAIVFVALVAGGAYAATRIVKSRRRQELRQRPEYYEAQQSRYQARPEPDLRTAARRPAPGSSMAHRPDVEDELSRLKREMGS